jgi:hypothetical protein
MAYQPIHIHYHLFEEGRVVPSVIVEGLQKSYIFKLSPNGFHQRNAPRLKLLQLLKA